MLRQLTDLRRGERARTALGFLVLLFVVGSYTIVKAVREAVFLSRFSVTELSLVALGLAVLSGTIVAVYLRATSGSPRTVWSSAAMASWRSPSRSSPSVCCDRDPPGWLAWLFYVWSSVFGVFIVMQFWLLASNLFDVREAKRTFGIIGLGAIVGGLVGGVVARALASRVAAFGLLLIASAMLLAAAAAAGALLRLERTEPRPLSALFRETGTVGSGETVTAGASADGGPDSRDDRHDALGLAAQDGRKTRVRQSHRGAGRIFRLRLCLHVARIAGLADARYVVAAPQLRRRRGARRSCRWYCCSVLARCSATRLFRYRCSRS